MKLKREKSDTPRASVPTHKSKFIISGVPEAPIDEIVRIRRFLRDQDRLTDRDQETAEKSETND